MNNYYADSSNLEIYYSTSPRKEILVLKDQKMESGLKMFEFSQVAAYADKSFHFTKTCVLPFLTILRCNVASGSEQWGFAKSVVGG